MGVRCQDGSACFAQAERARLILWHRTSSLRWSATAALRKQSGRGWSPAQRAPRRLVTGHPLWVVRHQARAGEGQGPPHTPPRGGSIRDGAPSMGAVTTHLPWGKGRCVVVCSCNLLQIAIAHCDGRHRCHSRGNGDGSHLHVRCICKRLLGLRLQNRCSVAKPDPATPHGQSSWGAAEGEGRFPTAITTLQSFLGRKLFKAFDEWQNISKIQDP